MLKSKIIKIENEAIKVDGEDFERKRIEAYEERLKELGFEITNKDNKDNITNFSKLFQTDDYNYPYRRVKIMIGEEDGKNVFFVSIFKEDGKNLNDSVKENAEILN